MELAIEDCFPVRAEGFDRDVFDGHAEPNPHSPAYGTRTPVLIVCDQTKVGAPLSWR